MDLGEVLFGQWCIFLALYAPVVLGFNALMALVIDTWLRAYPKHKYAKAGVVLVGILLLSLGLQWSRSQAWLSDPNWESVGAAGEFARAMWLRWGMMTVLFWLIPQSAALVFRESAMRTLTGGRRFTYPLLVVLLTVWATVMYAFGAIIMGGTGD